MHVNISEGRNLDHVVIEAYGTQEKLREKRTKGGTFCEDEVHGFLTNIQMNKVAFLFRERERERERETEREEITSFLSVIK